MIALRKPAVWFPTVRAGTGTDVFTLTLAKQMHERGIRAEITWLPPRSEYAPWTVRMPTPPEWANLVHINTWMHPRFLPKHLPVIATLHHSIHDPGATQYKGRLRSVYHRHWIRHIERATMRRTDRVVAVSQFASASARALVLDRPMEVIHNGVDVEQFHPPVEYTPHKPFRLLYVGSWTGRKGVDLFTPIMQELGQGFELYYTGGSVAADKAGKRVPPNMLNIGKLPNACSVADAMRDADAFLFPSRSEGLPLSLLEAMACGLPVIATRGSSMTEVVVDGVTGFLCPRDDVGSFAEAARRLAENPCLRATMSKNGRGAAKSRFDINVMADTYLTLYQQSVAGLRP